MKRQRIRMDRVRTLPDGRSAAERWRARIAAAKVGGAQARARFVLGAFAGFGFVLLIVCAVEPPEGMGELATAVGLSVAYIALFAWSFRSPDKAFLGAALLSVASLAGIALVNWRVALGVGSSQLCVALLAVLLAPIRARRRYGATGEVEQPALLQRPFDA